MELTKEQLLQVEVYLQNKDFHFIDLRHEILDPHNFGYRKLSA